MSAEANNHPVVVLISADGEWQAVIESLSPAEKYASPYGEYFWHTAGPNKFIMFQSGWGKIAAAASTQYIIDMFKPQIIINIGTCGGFFGKVKQGEILLVNKTVIYDIVEQMTEQDQALAAYTTAIDLEWIKKPYPLTVNKNILVSADQDIIPSSIPYLIEKFSAVAADWESGAIAWVAGKNQIRCLILRVVSDVVSPEGSPAYNSYEYFTQASKTYIPPIIESLPLWLQ